MSGGSERGDTGLRLAELVAAFSLASDLGLGQPMEHVLRSWLLAARIGERVGLGEDERTDLYYTALLAWVGCVADTREVTSWFGDDIAFRGESYEIDLAGLPLFGFMLRHVGAGGSLPHRLRLGVTLVVTGGRAVARAMLLHCMATAQMAHRLGLGAGVRQALPQMFARWDGKGVPHGVGGNDLTLSMRLFHLADIVEVYHRTHGVEGAVDVARSRRGKQFDPTIVDEFCRDTPELLKELEGELDWAALIEAEPGLRGLLDSALEAVADFTDLRSPFLAGHSRGVAALAESAARQCAVPENDVVALRRAALLHDLGRHAVPGTIWDKAGPLTASEFERVRLHSYYTERMLARPPALARLGAIASLHHERLDGSGYHRGVTGPGMSTTSRLLAVADAYHAMIEPRPHRPALGQQKAVAELRKDVRAGRFDGEAVDAVLAAAGHSTGKRRAGPAGLTPREIEVLTLIARGASNRQVARQLGISARTAGTHIERIYTKIGASTRSTATLFALQHGMLDSLAPVDLSGEPRTTA